MRQGSQGKRLTGRVGLCRVRKQVSGRANVVLDNLYSGSDDHGSAMLAPHSSMLMSQGSSSERIE